MRRLGYTRYVAQGGDVGAGVTDAMGRQAPEGLIGIHTNLLVPALRRHHADGHRRGTRRGRADRHLPGSPATATSSRWPPARRRSATPCSTHRSPWPPGWSTTTPTPTTRSPRAFVDGQPSGNLTRDHILDNITLYWLTGTGASAARSYWEAYGADAPAAAAAAAGADDPVRLHDVPGRDLADAAQLGRASYPNVVYFNEVDKGGHFAAWEEPELFATRCAPRSGRCAEGELP